MIRELIAIGHRGGTGKISPLEIGMHPASTMHSGMAEEDRLEVATTAGLIRHSVGIEDVEDLLDDLEQALQWHNARFSPTVLSDPADGLLLRCVGYSSACVRLVSEYD